MRILLTGLFLMVFVSTALLSQPAREAEFDEMADSPTVTLDCGVFPAARVIVDGQEIEGRGIIRNSRTYLPAREALERLGGRVTWVGSQRAFYAQFPNRQRTVRVTVGSPIVRIYTYSSSSRYGAGEYLTNVRLNATPFQCEGRIYAAVRTAAEAAGASVSYESRTKTVRITSPQKRNR